MLYWKYSPDGIFYLNEYCVLIPVGILTNYFIIRKIRSRKEKIKQLKKLLDQVKREKKIRRILYVSLGLNAFAGIFLTRGGQNLIDVDYIQCNIEQGLRFLDDTRLRRIIHDLYRYKRRGKIIYITSTAVCHLINRYGQMFLALPFAIGDFGLTNIYQTARKVVVTVLLGGIGPLWFVGGPVALAIAFMCAVSGLRIAFSNLDLIPTSPVYETENLRPRIPNEPEVIVVNNRNKIIMSNLGQEKRECWLPDQGLFNSNCKVKATQIPDAIDSVSTDLNYNQIVNMRDVTGLDRTDFSDVLDLGQPQPCVSTPHKAKMVNFLDKFGDSGTIETKDTWDISESTIPEKLRVRNEL